MRHFLIDAASQKWNEYSKNSKCGDFVLKMERRQCDIPAKRDEPGLKMGAAGRRFCGGKK
jgi:hypothetical protein